MTSNKKQTATKTDCKQEIDSREDRYRAFLEFMPEPVFVFNQDGTVVYLNPAFEKVFGYTLKEVKGKRIPFIPDGYRTETRLGLERLYRERIVHGVESKRLTKDGRLLDIIIDGAVFYDEDNKPAGQVITLRDITREKRTARSNQALFRIAQAIHRYRGLDGLLDFITKQVRSLMAVEGALVILLDEAEQEFFFRAAAFEDSQAEKIFKETRFPLSKGVAGQVFRTGKPMVVHDYYKSPYSHLAVDVQTGHKTRNMLQVPIWIEERMIGVLCVINKKAGHFDEADQDLLNTIAGMVAHPIENARINHALALSYDAVKSLNQAKDRVIHHLSHELKTPVAVLTASVSLMRKKYAGLKKDAGFERIMQRMQRNLDRILEMQYEIEDILRERDYKSHQLLSTLLAACTDTLESMIADESENEELIPRIRERIDKLFGPREALSQKIHLEQFVEAQIEQIRPLFSHRTCRLETCFEKTHPVWIPPEVLKKVITGLIRNAVENTPDKGLIRVSVRKSAPGPEFEVADEGVGFSAENQQLFFEDYFTPRETLQYASKNPYDFNAGGRGFDLLRIKIFSEQYGFAVSLKSDRCGHIPGDADVCPGDISDCDFCDSREDCQASGGATISVCFNPNFS